MSIGLIEQTLSNLFPSEGEVVVEAARYSLEGGKRLRPLLALTTATSLKIQEETSILYPACALEMIHTYSLIHDDLPYLDDDDVRRGRPSLHRVYTEAQALLTGDFLLTYAFETLSKAPHLSEEKRNHLARILSLRAGKEGMIGGQMLELSGPTESNILDIHKKKTASLFAAALEFGAICAGYPLLDKLSFSTIGTHLGLAFQLADDLADGDGAVLLWNREKIQKLRDKHANEALKGIAKLPKGAPQLKKLSEQILCYCL